MARSLWLLDVLADEFRGVRGFQVDYVPGWQRRGRDTADHVGVMDHHTGGGSYNALLNFMAHNSAIAPLCNYATSRPANSKVRITVVAAGRANHAGVGNLPWTGANGGNRRSLGGEHQNTGGQAWPGQQVEAIRRCAAALLRHMGTNASRRTDHRIYAANPPGWPGRKVDRYSVNQRAEDAAVNRLILAPALEDSMDVRLIHYPSRGQSAYLAGSVVGKQGTLLHIKSGSEAKAIAGDDWHTKTVVMSKTEFERYEVID